MRYRYYGLICKPLGGNKSGLWRYRVDKYRIICQIRDQVMIVLVIENQQARPRV